MEEYLTLDTKIISDKAVSTIMPAQTDILQCRIITCRYGSAALVALCSHKLGKILDIFNFPEVYFGSSPISIEI